MLLRSFRRRFAEVVFDGRLEAADDVAAQAKSYVAEIAKTRERLVVPADPAEAAKLAAHYTSKELGEIVVNKQGAATVFDVVVTSDGADHEVERLALGQRAVLSWNVGGVAPRAFHGVLAAVKLEEIHEVARRSARYQMRLAPRLWLLKRKRRTRIFQQMSVRDIVTAVLGEVGVATRWALLREYPVREYCTQYEESDLRFITRLLAESGIYFFLAQGPLDEGGTAAADALIPGDSLIFGDDASGYQPIGADDRDQTALSSAAPPLYFLAMQETRASHLDKITRFSPRTTVRASTATFRDYDPERPMARLVSTAASTQPFARSETSLVDAAVAAFAGAGAGAPAGLEVYEHHGPFLFPKWSFASEEAPLILRQKRRRASVASGDSGCPDLAPGHRFALENHPGEHLNREFVVTSVEHRGEARPQGEGEWRTYKNTFSCAPAEIACIPPRPKRRSVQVSLTALVVGPPGEEIHVDAIGQIKVQFHWDRDGVYDDRSSCWIRTMHAWGGAGWGAQFIPRVGMVMVITSRLRPPPDMRGHLRARGLRGHPRALRAANGGAAEGAGEESGVRVRVNGNSSGRGRKRDDVARAEVCREDDVREVRRSLG